METSSPATSPCSSPDSFYKKVSMDLYPYMVREVSSLTLLSKAGVPNIVRLKSVQSDGCIELQKYPGDLTETVLESNDDVVHAIYRILVMLYNLQSINLYHRDIKPDNILSTNDGNIVLCDFGLSRYYSCGDNPMQCTSYVQTSGFRAPELLFRNLDKSDVTGKPHPINMDIWSLGITALQLMDLDDFIVHNESLTLSELFDAYCTCYLPGGLLDTYIADIPEGSFMAEFLTVVTSMLTINADERPDAEHLLTSPVFDYYRNDDDIMDPEVVRKFEQQRVDQILEILPTEEKDPVMINHLISIDSYHFNNKESAWLAAFLLYRCPDRNNINIMDIIALSSAVFDTDMVELKDQSWLELFAKFNYDLMFPVTHPLVVHRLVTLFNSV